MESVLSSLYFSILICSSYIYVQLDYVTSPPTPTPTPTLAQTSWQIYLFPFFSFVLMIIYIYLFYVIIFFFVQFSSFLEIYRGKQVKLVKFFKDL